jgi:deazaflavin-dependent oxidoreductase (nitroreductase family)
VHTHPGWYHNLKAHPRAKIEAGTETFWAHAEELNGPGRDAMWPQLLAASPSLRDYQTKTRRQIPIFVLTRAARPARWPPAATVPLLHGLT